MMICDAYTSRLQLSTFDFLQLIIHPTRTHIHEASHYGSSTTTA